MAFLSLLRSSVVGVRPSVCLSVCMCTNKRPYMYILSKSYLPSSSLPRSLKRERERERERGSRDRPRSHIKKITLYGRTDSVLVSGVQEGKSKSIYLLERREVNFKCSTARSLIARLQTTAAMDSSCSIYNDCHTAGFN